MWSTYPGSRARASGESGCGQCADTCHGAATEGPGCGLQSRTAANGTIDRHWL